jgi:alpha-glucosidase
MKTAGFILALAFAGISPATAQSAFAPLEVVKGSSKIRVDAITDSVLRVRISRNGKFAEDASWAVPAAVRHQKTSVTLATNGLETALLAANVDPRTLGLTVSNSNGQTILADASASVSFNGDAFTLRKSMPVGERYYGLGDKTGPFDRRGASYVNWTTDAWGFDRGTDPIYKSIPFFVSTGGPGGAYGLFLDNTSRSWFDFGHRDQNVLQIGADGGPIDYYVIAGPTVADVVRHYAELTGKPPLPPLWSLGFQQSRYSYMSETEVRDVAKRLRSDSIPTDVIWLDIDFQDRNRPFTTNPKTFPNLNGLVRDMSAQGIKLVTITDLHVASAPKQGYAPYDSGLAGNHFIKNPDGSLYVAPVWPGPSVFPDFTRKASRDWWGAQYKTFVDDGVAGFWNDMNEPAIFETPTKTIPLDTVHRIDSDDFSPRTATHAEVHNVYGMQNGRATYEGLLKLRPNVRPYVMTRATYAGGQRYAVTWTGDNSSSWDHLKLAVQQMLNLGLSGFAWSGADVGGFIGGASPELMTRWYQIAAFSPVFRSHASNSAPRAEPWVDGPEHLAIRRRFIEERYRLLPYIYAVAEQNARTGDPVMRPTFYDYPSLSSAPCDQAMAFTLGRDLLVAPSPKAESTHAYEVCLPSVGWFDLWTGQQVRGEAKESGVEVVKEMPRLERLPVFVRAGAILPRQPLVQSTAQRPDGPLELHIYPGPDCRGDLYFDDGVSVQGASLRQTVRCTMGKDGLMLDFDQRQGTFRPWWKQIAVTVHGWGGKADIRGANATGLHDDAAAKTISFVIPDQSRAASLVIVRR